MSRLTAWMDRTFYPTFVHRWDDKIFRERVLSVLTEYSRVLDLGAGRGAKEEMDFRGTCAFIAGADPEGTVLQNPRLDDAKVLLPPDYVLPFPDGAFDVVISNSVIEHLQDPDAFFREVHRVLKPKGRFLAKTPNKWHYVALLARTTPHWFHEFYNGLRGRESHDTFPTTYPCNTKSDIVRLAEDHRFDVAAFDIIEGRPEYLRLNAVMYVCGLVYERFVNAFSPLQHFRCVIMIQLVKPQSNDSE